MKPHGHPHTGQPLNLGCCCLSVDGGSNWFNMAMKDLRYIGMCETYQLLNCMVSEIPVLNMNHFVWYLKIMTS